MACIYKGPRYEFTYGSVVFGNQDFFTRFLLVLWAHVGSLWRNSYQMMKKRADVPPVLALADDPDKRQASEKVCHINAIADNKQIIDREADIVGLDIHFAFFVFIQKDAGMDGGGPARRHQIGGEGQGAAGVEDIVDDHHGSAADIL